MRIKLAARGVTVIEPVEVLATHLLESVQNGFDRLMSRRALREALDAFTDLSDTERAAANKRLLEEFVPDKVSYENAAVGDARAAGRRRSASAISR